VTIIISITWYYSRHFTLARIRVRVRVTRRMHLARAQVHTSEYVSAPLLSSKLLKTSWFLIASVQRTSLRKTFFLSLFLSFGYLRKILKKLSLSVTREREYLQSRVYLPRKQKFRFLLRASTELISFSRTIINRISLYNYFASSLGEELFP